MNAENLTAVSRERTIEEFDEVFDLLAHPHRRTVIDELESDVTVTVRELAERIAERRDSASLSSARIALCHNHLPRLAEAGVVSYDHDEKRCELNDAAAVRAVLATAREQV
ncbi:hypothetical protein [Halostella sp. PRR32]|uniref:DUF7344 domain-containing protein n=1 Tax=Halostella sp. PRR32 TaxID=3098147 RepID=UPI002B1DC0C4|nr:hypothetical protein [Halostella sp. PRR32]